MADPDPILAPLPTVTQRTVLPAAPQRGALRGNTVSMRSTLGAIVHTIQVIAGPILLSLGTAILAGAWLAFDKTVVLMPYGFNPLFIAGSFIVIGGILFIKTIYDYSKQVRRITAQAQQQAGLLQQQVNNLTASLAQVQKKEGAFAKALKQLPQVLAELRETYPPHQKPFKNDDLYEDIKDELLQELSFHDLSDSHYFEDQQETIYVTNYKIGIGAIKEAKIAVSNIHGIIAVSETQIMEDLEEFDRVRIYPDVLAGWQRCQGDDQKGGLLPLYKQWIVQTPEGPRQYLAQKLCNGGDLFNVLKSGLKLTNPQKDAIFMGALRALSKMASINLFHRDAKPENLALHWLDQDHVVSFFIDPDNSEFSTYKPAPDEEGRIAKQASIGTVRNAAPELFFTPFNAIDHEKVEVWGLGLIAYLLYIDKKKQQYLLELEKLAKETASAKGSNTPDRFMKGTKIKTTEACYKKYTSIFNWENVEKKMTDLEKLLLPFLRATLEPDPAKRCNLKTAKKLYKQYVIARDAANSSS